MNTTHVHLLLNHVSILGALFSVIVLAWGMLAKNKSIRTVALAGFVVAALFAVPVFTTGEDAEESVEHIAGISKSLIESHEETAEVAFWLIEALGLFSLILLIGEKLKWQMASRASWLILILSLVAAGSISYTGYLGGKIRHTEISIASAAAEANENGQTGEKDEHDD